MDEAVQILVKIQIADADGVIRQTHTLKATSHQRAGQLAGELLERLQKKQIVLERPQDYRLFPAEGRRPLEEDATLDSAAPEPGKVVSLLFKPDLAPRQAADGDCDEGDDNSVPAEDSQASEDGGTGSDPDSGSEPEPAADGDSDTSGASDSSDEPAPSREGAGEPNRGVSSDDDSDDDHEDDEPSNASLGAGDESAPLPRQPQPASLSQPAAAAVGTIRVHIDQRLGGGFLTLRAADTVGDLRGRALHKFKAMHPGVAEDLRLFRETPGSAEKPEELAGDDSPVPTADGCRIWLASDEHLVTAAAALGAELESIPGPEPGVSAAVSASAALSSPPGSPAGTRSRLPSAEGPRPDILRVTLPAELGQGFVTLPLLAEAAALGADSRSLSREHSRATDVRREVLAKLQRKHQGLAQLDEEDFRLSYVAAGSGPERQLADKDAIAELPEGSRLALVRVGGRALEAPAEAAVLTSVHLKGLIVGADIGCTTLLSPLLRDRFQASEKPSAADYALGARQRKLEVEVDWKCVVLGLQKVEEKQVREADIVVLAIPANDTSRFEEFRTAILGAAVLPALLSKGKLIEPNGAQAHRLLMLSIGALRPRERYQARHPNDWDLDQVAREFCSNKLLCQFQRINSVVGTKAAGKDLEEAAAALDDEASSPRSQLSEEEQAAYHRELRQHAQRSLEAFVLQAIRVRTHPPVLARATASKPPGEASPFDYRAGDLFTLLDAAAPPPAKAARPLRDNGPPSGRGAGDDNDSDSSSDADPSAARKPHDAAPTVACGEFLGCEFRLPRERLEILDRRVHPELRPISRLQAVSATAPGPKGEAAAAESGVKRELVYRIEAQLGLGDNSGGGELRVVFRAYSQLKVAKTRLKRTFPGIYAAMPKFPGPREQAGLAKDHQPAAMERHLDQLNVYLGRLPAWPLIAGSHILQELLFAPDVPPAGEQRKSSLFGRRRQRTSPGAAAGAGSASVSPSLGPLAEESPEAPAGGAGDKAARRQARRTWLSSLRSPETPSGDATDSDDSDGPAKVADGWSSDSEGPLQRGADSYSEDTSEADDSSASSSSEEEQD